MLIEYRNKIIPMVAIIAAFTLLPTSAKAQTANMTADVTVQNALTLATPAQLNFGTIAAVRDAVQTATVTVDTAGAGSVATGGGDAVTAIVDGTALSNGQVTIADGANGATLNIVINNVVDPFTGAESFALAGFETSWNGGAAAPRTAGTGFTESFDSAFGGGTNTLDIGATITTTTGATPYSEGAYAGSYDVVFSY